MVVTQRKLTFREKQVEQFWKDRVSSFSLGDERKICEAYKMHLIGTTDYEEMGLVHAGVNKCKDDFAGFYRELSDILEPSEDELEVLVSEGLEYAGFMCMLAEPYGMINNRPSGLILANMHVFK